MTDIKDIKYKDALFQNAKSSTFKNAIYLRKNETNAERVLWNALRKNAIDGLKFRRQHPISTFVADFYCPKKKLLIELDGAVHAFKESKEMDLLRTQKLNELDIKVIRFKNSEVEKNLKTVLKKIEILIQKL